MEYAGVSVTDMDPVHSFMNERRTKMNIDIADDGATLTISPEEMNRILEKCGSTPCSFFSSDQEREDAMKVFAPALATR